MCRSGRKEGTMQQRKGGKGKEGRKEGRKEGKRKWE
jgi:hypothetical protein